VRGPIDDTETTLAELSIEDIAPADHATEEGIR
jgi:hypothetical protein